MAFLFQPAALVLHCDFVDMDFKADQAGFQYQEQAAWFPSIASTYHLGIDGISLPMVLLTTLLTPLALLASFSIKDRVKAYMILFLLLETGMLGVFVPWTCCFSSSSGKLAWCRCIS